MEQENRDICSYKRWNINYLDYRVRSTTDQDDGQSKRLRVNTMKQRPYKILKIETLQVKVNFET